MLVGVVEVHQQVAGLLGEPRCGRVRGDAEDVDSAGGVFDDEEGVEPVQVDGVDVDQVAGENAVGLRAEELRPGRTCSSRRGIDARRGEDLPHGGGADLIAEPDEFAVDAAIPPVGILGSEAHDQRTDTGGDSGSANACRRGGPAAADELMVPAQDRGRSDQESAAATSGSSRTRAAITARSLQLSRGRGVRRCSTAS